MAEKITFQREVDGYSIHEVDAYVELLLKSYEELLAHYQEQETNLESLEQEIANKGESSGLPDLGKDPSYSPADYSQEALELLHETTKIVSHARAQARVRITALVDQASLHTRRLEDALQVMKDELDKMYAFIDEQL